MTLKPHEVLPPPSNGNELPRLRVRGLSKSFGGVSALTNVDIEVHAGETLGLIGPNGSGKTTLVNCVSGVVVPTDGVIELGGHDITRWTRTRRARAGLARTYQSVRLFRELTVAENVEVGVIRASGETRRSSVMATLEQQGLITLARVPVADLPYGLQRRVEIARALVSEPDVLLLDEPAAGLDERETDELGNLIVRLAKDWGIAVLLIEHDVGLVLRVCDRVEALDFGRSIASGTPAEIAADEAVIAAYLGAPEPGHGQQPVSGSSAEVLTPVTPASSI